MYYHGKKKPKTMSICLTISVNTYIYEELMPICLTISINAYIYEELPEVLLLPAPCPH